jgi:chromosome segregation ATPase
MVKQELEDKIAALERDLDGMRNAIRRIAEDYSNSLNQISSLTSEVTELKSLVKAVEQKFSSIPIHQNGIQRYE